MKHFTYEEMELMSIYDPGTREGLIDLCIHTALLQAAEHTCLHLGPHGGIRHHQRAPPQQYGVPSQMREDAAALIVSS